MLNDTETLAFLHYECPETVLRRLHFDGSLLLTIWRHHLSLGYVLCTRGADFARYLFPAICLQEWIIIALRQCRCLSELLRILLACPPPRQWIMTFTKRMSHLQWREAHSENWSPGFGPLPPKSPCVPRIIPRQIRAWDHWRMVRVLKYFFFLVFGCVLLPLSKE
mgnify:CR=1 FL=1